MATLTVYANADGHVYYENSDYETARTGTGAGTASGGDAHVSMGQLFAGAIYYVIQGCFSFDTSSIGASSAVTSATYSAVADLIGGGTADTLEGRLKTWVSGGLQVADFTAGNGPSSNTLLCSRSMAGMSAGTRYDWTSEAAFPTNVNKTGDTEMQFTALKQIAGGTAPTGEEYIRVKSADTGGTTDDPRLIVVYTASEGGLMLASD